MKTPIIQILCWLSLPVGVVLGADSRTGSARSAGTGTPAPVLGEYVLQPQDVIKVHVFQEEDINKQGEVGISGDHTVTLPMIGTISLKGKTRVQAEELIRALYDKDYIINPTVTVTVQKYSDRSVNVTGQVNEAGRVQFPPEKGLTIFEAITLAGGYTRLADLRKVKLTTKNGDGEPEQKLVDVDAIMKGNARDVPLRVGDSISVPERVI